MKFTDNNMCGAWRCDGFCCSEYSDYDYNCTHDLCHVCSVGHKCINCGECEECDDFENNHKLQMKEV